MAYLRTLEGVDQGAANMNDLFDVNDTLGCLIYGADAWNKIKSYACNRALDLLAAKNDFAANLKKITGRKNYVISNDILERAFGFNHNLGCELYGVDEWREFVLDCKTYTPPDYSEEMGSIGGAIKSLVRPSGILYPENWTPGGVAQWLLAAGATNVADAFSAIGSPGQSEKAANEKATASQAAANTALQYAAETEKRAADIVAQAKQDYSAEYARAKAQEDATAQANADLQYNLRTNPEYMANQRQNYFMLGGAVLLAAIIFAKK